MKKFVLGIVALMGLAGVASAQPGSPNDAYIFGDGSSQIYQVTLGGTEVLNPRTGNSRFSVSSDLQSNSPYLARWGGVNNNFYVGGFGGLIEVDGNTGAFVRRFTSGVSLDCDISYTGNTIFISDSAGIGEYRISDGVRIRTLTSGVGGGGNTLMKTRGTDIYVSTWGFSGGVQLRKYDQITGNQDMAFGTVIVPFAVQALNFDSFGNFYASSLYGNTNGVHKFDFATKTFSMFAAAAAAPGGSASGWPNGPHGFEFGPDGKLYQAFASGAVEVYNGITGAWERTLIRVNDKLTDIRFKPIPAPGALMVLGLAGIAAGRRRR